MDRKLMTTTALALGFAALGLQAAGPLTFDFAAASARMFPKVSNGGGNLINVADGAFKSGGGSLRCIQRKPDPDIRTKIRSKVTARFEKGEGTIQVDASVRDLFRENPVEAASVYADLSQTVPLPDDKGGLYAISFDSLNGGAPGLLTGAFIQPQHVDADGTVRPVGKEMRRRTIGDDSEWFPVRWTVLVPSGANRVRIDMCRYNVGRFVFRNVSMTRLDVSNQPKVTLRQGAHGCADPSFAIGEGQAGYITWEWKHRYDFTPLKAKDVRFELTLPKGFELRSLTFAREKTIRTESLADGSTRVTFEPAGHNAVPGESFERRAQMGAVVRATAGVGCEGLGTLRALTADGADYSTVVTTRYYTVETVRAKAVPKNYTNGLLPILDKFSGTGGELAFAETAVAAGARWLVAGQFTGTPVWLSAWRTAGMRTITDTAAVVRDGYYIGPSKGRPEADRFRTNKGVHNAQHLACPSAIYEERPFFLTNTVPFINRRLAGFDGLWSNWEPYRYYGANACMCDTCRRKFAEYVGVSEEEMKKDWPKELMSGGKWSGRIAAFRAREHGRLVKTVDKYVRAATGGEKSVGFMPGISWSQVASTWRQNGAAPEVCHLEYAGSLKWLEPWGPYPHWDNASPYFHTEGSGMIESFLAARDVRQQINRDYPLPNRPRIQGFPQGYQCGWIVQPEWMEIELDSYFFNGWESAILYHFPGGYDARYWRALANATERAAKYEDYVFKGRRCDEEIAVTVDPACRKTIRNPSRHLTNLQEVSLVQHVAYRLDGKVLVAVFNFREKPVQVSLKDRGTFTVPPARTTVLEFER